jgi:DNA replication factor GINS
MAPSEPLSYDEIHSIQKRERSTRALTKVPQDFYERLASYLADARAGLADESAKGPSPRLVLLQGQFRNLEEMGREIQLLRLRKVTELAFAAVEGGALNDRVLTAEELAFAKQVQGLVETTRSGLTREGGSPAGPTPPPPAPKVEAPRAPAPERPAAKPPATAPTPAAPAQAPPVVVLRILDDIPPFEGEDNRVYRLKREDVITLPREIAQILVRRKKAVELQVPP